MAVMAARYRRPGSDGEGVLPVRFIYCLSPDTKAARPMERRSITALASVGEMTTSAALHYYVKSFMSGSALGVSDDKSDSQTMSGNPHL